MILDTSVIIQIFKKGKSIKRELFSYQPEEYGISIATYIEITFGFFHRPTKQSLIHQEHFAMVIKRNILKVHMLDTGVAEVYAQLQSRCMKEGKQIGIFDGLIAATAMKNNMYLATLDSDFKRIDGLKLITP